MTRSDEVPEGRAPLDRRTALTRLAGSFDSLSDLFASLNVADDDRERRAFLIAIVSAAWLVRDRATDAYEALVHSRDVEGIARGVLE